MSLRTKSIDWTQLIQFNKDGIAIADYGQVRAAITAQFKQIYGQDIDLATTSADGIYVETLCLMISNILQSFKNFYAQLDVRTAGGSFLDALCALSNVYRKAETHSTCPVVLTLDEDASESYVTDKISLLDKNGNVWSYTDKNGIVFEPGKQQTVVVTCEVAGPVRADAGWIDRLVENNVVMKVSQETAAALGSYSETDSELRARRNSSLGATGNTVLETMIGTLLSITGIDDVKIYNNDSSSSITALDGTNILSHDIYVILRQKQNIEIADSLLCSSIYEKLTPGIRTTDPGEDVKHGTRHSFKYLQSSTGVPVQSEVVQMVYWKEAEPISPTITIELAATSNYGSANNSTSNRIAQKVIDYLNKLRLSSKITVNDIWNVVFYADPQFRGQSTYSIKSISIDKTDDADNADDVSSFTLPDTYFNYDLATDVIIYDKAHIDGTVKIVIGNVVGLTLTNLSSQMNVSNQTMLVYAFDDEGWYSWIQTTVSGNQLACEIDRRTTAFIAVVFDGQVKAEDASWDNYVKQTTNIEFDNSATSLEYDVNSFTWQLKTMQLVEQMKAMQLKAKKVK